MNDLNSIILDLSYNNINVVSSDIKYLTNLQQLDLDNNNIKIIPYDW